LPPALRRVEGVKIEGLAIVIIGVALDGCGLRRLGKSRNRKGSKDET
jgi:hypothetical protein